MDATGHGGRPARRMVLICWPPTSWRFAQCVGSGTKSRHGSEYQSVTGKPTSSGKLPSSQGHVSLAAADRSLSDAVAAPGAGIQDFIDWVLSALRRGDLAEAEQRLNRARARWNTTNWAPLESEVLMMGRDYQRAASLIAAALPTARDANEAALLKELKFEADLMRAIAARIKLHDKRAESDDLAVYAINLDENAERWERISRLVTPRSLHRIGGVPGRYLADGVVKRFGPQASPHFKGTLGCFLAHYAAWEAHLKSTEPHALILEDDCLPLIDIPRSGTSLMLPADFDICFLTNGLGVLGSERAATEMLPIYRPLADSVAERAAQLLAPGGYGYVLSRRGAEQLIARVDEDGFFGDVDWRMIAYCLPRHAVDGYPQESFARGVLSAHLQVIVPRPPLAGFCCYPGLVKPGRIGSVRERDNERRHAHLWIETAGGT